MFGLRSLSFSAFRAGSLFGLRVRPSSHSASGCVLVAAFASQAAASRFARRWAGRLGMPVVVRLVPGGWSVSVPVVPALAAAAFCRSLRQVSAFAAVA
jgi:hypothetical protein